MTETRRERRPRPVAAYRSLSWRSSSSRPTKGASRASLRFRPPRPATTQGAPGGDGGCLPRSTCSPAGRRRSRGRRPPGRLAHEHGPCRRDRLEPGRGVDEVARDHPLVGGTGRDRRLAGQHPRPGPDRRPQGVDGVEELEGGPDGPLGVVLVGDRCPPDRHDRIADELLDRAPVPPDDVTREVEVPGEGLADVLGIPLRRIRREAHQIGEQDRHQPALRLRLGGGGRRTQGQRHQRRGAGGAEPGARRVRGGTACGARSDQRGGALGAEPRAGPVTCAAARAGRDGDGLRDAVRSSGRGPKDTGRPADTPASNGSCAPGERLLPARVERGRGDESRTPCQKGLRGLSTTGTAVTYAGSC